jgi:hypothetical protein
MRVREIGRSADEIRRERFNSGWRVRGHAPNLSPHAALANRGGRDALAWLVERAALTGPR